MSYLNSMTDFISGFRCEEDENCALLGNYAASSGNFLSTFRDNHFYFCVYYGKLMKPTQWKRSFFST